MSFVSSARVGSLNVELAKMFLDNGASPVLHVQVYDTVRKPKKNPPLQDRVHESPSRYGSIH